MKKTYDIAVIGGGPAGYVAAIRGAQLGAKVILFEKDNLGGTCLNRGCIPAKTYLKTAETMEHIKGASNRGIHVEGQVSLDMSAVVDYKDKVVGTLSRGIGSLLKANGVEVVRGCAWLASETEIQCGGAIYHANNTILCGGSKVTIISIPGIEIPEVMTSDEILKLREKPNRLCVIGGGVIGCEFASAFASFGTDVTIVELEDRLIPMFDREVSAELQRNFCSAGMHIKTGAKVLRISRKDGFPVVHTDAGDVVCDKILLSIGRRADLDCLGSLAERIKTERGKILVDDYMRTNIPNIYACGDINGRSMLAHSASHMGEIAAENCMGAEKKCQLRFVPSCIYTHPEASAVGLTEDAARKQYGDRVRVGKFPFSGNGRALASGEGNGFVKVVTDAKYGEVLGVHIIGGVATEMIAEATALISEEITAEEILERIIHAHPSFSEGFMEACADSLGRCIHLPPKKK